MKIRDLLEISFQNFKNRKSRIFFTILGVAVAISAVLFLVSFGYGLQSSLLEKITTTDSLLSLDAVPSDSELIKLDQGTINKISKIENVEKISPYVSFPGNIFFQNLISEVSVDIVDSNYLKLEGVIPKIGKNFTGEETNKIIINNSVASMFNIDPKDMLNQKINLTIYIPNPESENKSELVSHKIESDFEIMGIIDDNNTQGKVYLKNKDLDLTITEYSSIKIKVNNQNNLNSIRENLITQGFLVSALSDTIEQANKIFSIIQIILGVFGTVALVVAAIGLINTMTISLLERTNEIGIMRAIGASPIDVMWLMLGESLLIGFLGGVSGILLGLLSSQMVQMIVNLVSKNLGGENIKLFTYPLWFMIFTIILSTMVGLIGGFYPAKRAAKLNPLEALKYK